MGMSPTHLLVRSTNSSSVHGRSRPLSRPLIKEDGCNWCHAFPQRAAAGRRLLRRHANAKRRRGVTGLAGALAPAIGRAAVADVERPPTADLVARAGRAIAGIRIIPPPGESRRRGYRVEEKERGNDGRNRNEVEFVHRTAPF
jgi:hypothetical protein